MSPDVALRPVARSDLPIFFDHQMDPDASRMAAFDPRDRDAFMAHRQTILVDEDAIVRTVTVGGQVAGNVVCWTQDGEREVGYWIGRDHWGRGVATAALRAFLDEVVDRPLVAHAAEHNLGSIRVLERSGFAPTGSVRRPHDGVVELIYELTR